MKRRADWLWELALEEYRRRDATQRAWAAGMNSTDRAEIEDDEDDQRDQLATMPYAEYLQTPHWQVTRKAALDRAGRCCERCGTKRETLDVHHRSYKNRGTERSDQLVVLCRWCHRQAHNL